MRAIRLLAALGGDEGFCRELTCSMRAAQVPDPFTRQWLHVCPYLCLPLSPALAVFILFTTPAGCTFCLDSGAAAPPVSIAGIGTGRYQ